MLEAKLKRTKNKEIVAEGTFETIDQVQDFLLYQVPNAEVDSFSPGKPIDIFGVYTLTIEGEPEGEEEEEEAPAKAPTPVPKADESKKVPGPSK